MTPTQKEHIQYLLAQYLDGRITAIEEDQLFQYIEEEKDNTSWQELLEEFISAETEIIINKEEYQPILESILNKRSAPVKRIRPWIKWVAAASIIIIIATTALVISNQWGTKSGSIGEKSPSTADVPAPTNTRAVITLANGQKVYLDSAGNGVLAQENNVNVVRNEKGEIIYSPDHQITKSPIAYNTIFNPRGSKVISLTLSDGTKVWLNSESSLRYPASFAPSAVSREVEITGEAYFEVKHNSKQPFKVHLPNGSIVEDIGTAFNINSYSDEDNIKTTLIEGSIRVFANSASPASSAVKIKPGQQAVLNQANPSISQIEVQTNVDVYAVTAWKNGLFQFEDASVETVMKQIARWYDVEVVYESRPTKIFRGSIPREMSAAKVFKALEETGGVHFRIEGRKVIVLK